MLEYFRLWYLFVDVPPVARIFWGLFFLFYFVVALLARFRPAYLRKLTRKRFVFKDFWLFTILSWGLVSYMWWEAVITHWNWHEPFFGTASWWLGFGGTLVAAALGLIPTVVLFFKAEKLIKEATARNPDAPFKTKPGFWAAVYVVAFILMVPFGITGAILLKDWLIRLF